MLRTTHDKLLKITHDCRYDMHEPDEQDIKARVIGDHLDNAMGDDISLELLTRGAQEFVVVIERYGNNTVVVEQFNLATLIALARLANLDT